MAKGFKSGGRQKGTPNKPNPLRTILSEHSKEYFNPRLQVDNLTHLPKNIERVRLIQDAEGVVSKVIDKIPLVDDKGKPLFISDFEADLIALSHSERVSAEIKFLEFHTPRLKHQDIDVEVKTRLETIEDILKRLSQSEQESSTISKSNEI